MTLQEIMEEKAILRVALHDAIENFCNRTGIEEGAVNISTEKVALLNGKSLLQMQVRVII